MSTLPVTWRALGSRTGLRRALAAFVVFTVVHWSAWIAVILWAFGKGGAGLAAIASLAQLLPAAFLAPPLASVGDRMPRGRALVLVYVLVSLSAALTSAMLYVDAPVWAVLAAAALLMTGLSSVRPVHFAVLPQLAASPEELVSANALSAAGDEFAEFLGPVLAGFGVGLAGSWIVLGFGAVLGLVSALFCVRLVVGSTSEEDGEPEGWLAALEGIRSLKGDWAALALLLVLTIDFALAGGLDVLGVSFSDQVLGRGEQGAGLVIGAMGIGGFFGAVAAATFSRRPRLAVVIVGGAVMSGIAFAAIALLSLLGPVMVMLAVVGAGGAITLVAGRTLLQRSTDDTIMTRVFAVQESTTLLGTAVGAVAAPLFLAWLSPSAAFVPFGVAAVALGLGSLLLVRRLDARAKLYTTEVELLLGVPFLGVLPQYDLERLAARATWVDVPADEDVVRQGDEGREFYIVGSGDLAVTIDGVSRPGLHAGDSFGEIALLHHVPRTATVTAATPSRLLVIRAADFLAAVTGSEDGHALARETAAAHVARDQRATP